MIVLHPVTILVAGEDVGHCIDLYLGHPLRVIVQGPPKGVLGRPDHSFVLVPAFGWFQHLCSGMLSSNSRDQMKNPIALLLIAGVHTSLSHAAVVGHWRFEEDQLLTDSGPNNLTLTNPAASPNVTQVTRPGSGPTSAYPSTVLGSPNGGAAQFDGTGDRLVSPNDPLFSNSAFTVEAFVTLTADNSSTKAIAGLWNATGSQRGWLLALSASEVPVFMYSTDGGDSITRTSPLPALALNTDYYLAVTVDMADTSAAGITFYLMNLTTGGVLQSGGVTHVDTSFHSSTTSFSIGATAQPSSTWTGFIDEVRISDSKLTADQLMIVPEPASLGLSILGVVLAGCRRRRR